MKSLMYYHYHPLLQELLNEHFGGKPLDDPHMENLMEAVNEMYEQLSNERQNLELLKSAYNYMEQFAGVVAHDLRAPVRSISSLALWITEELEQGNTESVLDKLQLLQDKTAQLESLINGIMIYSRAGSSNSEKSYVSTKKLLENSIKLLSASDTLQIQMEGDFPDVYTSSVPLQQVFLNLISNTMKHAGEGSLLRIRCGFSYNGIVIAFLDNGNGIPQDAQAKIFDITTRAGAQNGIGLSITKRLIEVNGGSLILQSDEGRGTCFSFDWPCEILTTDKKVS